MKCRGNLVKKPTKEPEHQFENLYSLLCNEVWLRVAAHKTLNNNRERNGRNRRMTMSRTSLETLMETSHVSKKHSKPKPLNQCLSEGCTSQNQTVRKRGHLASQPCLTGLYKKPFG